MPGRSGVRRRTMASVPGRRRRGGQRRRRPAWPVVGSREAEEESKRAFRRQVRPSRARRQRTGVRDHHGRASMSKLMRPKRITADRPPVGRTYASGGGPPRGRARVAIARPSRSDLARRTGRSRGGPRMRHRGSHPHPVRGRRGWPRSRRAPRTVCSRSCDAANSPVMVRRADGSKTTMSASRPTSSAPFRASQPTAGTTLYTTTFPCHNCTRHIVAAGISRVVYVKPYPKSLAFQLHYDSISLEEKGWSRPGVQGCRNKVAFEPSSA